MKLTPRENMRRCLEFATPERIQRDLWTLPWAEQRYPGELAALRAEYPGDIVVAPAAGRPSPLKQGDIYTIGEAVNDWGCKFAFMHSDGCISAVVDDLVEVGVDTLNSQLFVMDMADLAQRAMGKITFGGEIDRQHVLPSPDPQQGRDAVRKVAEHLYDPRGGIIGQLEFGPAGNPATVRAVYAEWEKVDFKPKTISPTRTASLTS